MMTEILLKLSPAEAETLQTILVDFEVEQKERAVRNPDMASVAISFAETATDIRRKLEGVI